MRVLMVSDVYFPRINGVSTSIQTFRQTLPEEGVDVRLIAPAYDKLHGTEDWITRVPGRVIPLDPEDRLLHWRAMHRAVLKAAKGCDLIHTHTPFVAHYAGLKAARQLGIPIVTTYHTLFEEYLQHYAPFIPASLLRWQTRAWSRRQCNALDAIVVPSQAMKHRLEDYGVTAPLHILPTGIPLQQFSSGDGAVFRARHDIAANRPIALYVGRIAHEKNIGLLLRAMQKARPQHPQALLLIAGDGPVVSDLQKQAQQMGLGENVRFLGYLDRKQELPGCYAAANLFVFASRTETQGLVLLEAMASGLPVMALAAMGTVDILAPRRGAIISPDDADEFGQALADFFAHPERWPALSDEARHYAAEWPDAAMASRLARLYRNLVQSEQREWKAHTKVKPA
ncbi:MAG: Alpha-monoglucosyldiacylglycerol synthase [Betaproteobacteria bacterium ADurb.Bin341]|nr:MAG: Alpha-monoglucosyldiacylglycerol synthase [Betaproteobacteria bacterium ADurb.Bin341]